MKRSQANNKKEEEPRTAAATEASEARQPLILQPRIEPRGIEMQVINTGAGDQGRYYIRYN